MQISLNAPCPCGSGKKYKRCCGAPVSSRKGGMDGGHPDGLFEAVLALLQRGDWVKAAQACDRLLGLRPRDPLTLGLRGMASLGQGRHEEALAWINRGIEANPREATLYNFLGQAYAAQGDDVAAERAFGRAASLNPVFFDAWCNVGMTLLKMHRPEEAIPALERALALVPGDGEVRLILAEAYYQTHALEKAEPLLLEARTLGIQPLRTNLWLSAALRASDRLEEAEKAEVLALGARVPPALAVSEMVRIGRADVQIGKLDDAEYWLNKAISLQPQNTQPYIELTYAKKFTAADHALVERMESLLTLPGTDIRFLEFALGKVYADMGEDERAFMHYQAANELVRRKNPFRPEEWIAAIDKTIALFPAGVFDQLPKGSDTNVPILIVGTPRSGTTLTEQIISRHSQVAGAGEMQFWERLGESLVPKFPASYNQDVATKLAKGYLDLLRLHSVNALRITDKLPGNYRRLGLIHAVLPNAKIIHCRRHPVDACLSMYFQNFNDRHAYKFDLEGLAVFYEQYLKLMAHWRAILPSGTMYEIQYEELVEDPAGVSRHLMAFLGLDWESTQLDPGNQANTVFTASKWQARQPIYKTSRERWRRYEKHLGPLLRLLK